MARNYDRNPQSAVGVLINDALTERGLIPADIEHEVRIPRSSIYALLGTGYMSAPRIEVMRRFFGISPERMSEALLKDFVAAPDPRLRAAELRDQLQEEVDADDLDDEEGSRSDG